MHMGLGSPSASRSAVFTDDSQLEEQGDEDAGYARAAIDDDDDLDEREDTFEDNDFGIPNHQQVHEEGGGSDDGNERPHTAERVPGITVSFSDDGDQHSKTMGSPSSAASRMSVTSLLAMKRERIERQRRQSVQMSNTFTENSKHDSKIDKDRTLTMIKHKSKQNVAPGSHPSLE